MLSNTTLSLAEKTTLPLQVDVSQGLNVAQLDQQCHHVLFRFIPKYLNREDWINFTATSRTTAGAKASSSAGANRFLSNQLTPRLSSFMTEQTRILLSILSR